MLCPDDDVIIHVAPATNRTLALDKTRAFYIPQKEHWVMLKVAVWHYAAFLSTKIGPMSSSSCRSAPMPTTVKWCSSKEEEQFRITL